jgi:hypothetical protein
VRDVLVGEVWLCSGQSNMAMSMEKTDNFAQKRGACDLPRLRVFTITGLRTPLPRRDCTGAWVVCAPETAGRFSAVACIFGMQLQKARPGAREAFSLRLVDGLNAGTIAGLFIAVAAFFWANRLVPADLPGRQLWEVRAFFTVWGLSLVYAFLFQKRKWVDLLTLAAASLALVPVVNALTTSRHLGVSLPAGDWVMAGFDLTCLAGALLLGWMARKAARARKAPAKAGGKAAARTAAPAQVQAQPQPDTQAQPVARPRAPVASAMAQATPSEAAYEPR